MSLRRAASIVGAAIVLAREASGAPAGAGGRAGPPLMDDEAMGRKVQALLRAHQAEVFGCVAKQRGEVAGEALLRVFAGAHGEAARVEVLKVEEGPAAGRRRRAAPDGAEEGGGARAAAECVAGAARSWDLSALGADPGDQIVFPLAFRPKEGADSTALGAHVQLLELRAHETRALSITRPTALYMLGPGVPRVACGDGSLKVTAGELVYLPGACVARLTTEAAGDVLEIEGGEAAPAAAAPERHARGAPLPLPRGHGESVALLLERGQAPFAVGKLCATAGDTVPPHQHDGSDEVIFQISGQASVEVGDQHLTNKAGDLLTIPRGTRHAMRVDHDLCAVQVYAPAGPEQRFKRPQP